MSGGPGVVISGLSDPLKIENAEEETNDQSARRNNRQGPVKVLSQRMAEGPWPRQFEAVHHWGEVAKVRHASIKVFPELGGQEPGDCVKKTLIFNGGGWRSHGRSNSTALSNSRNRRRGCKRAHGDEGGFQEVGEGAGAVGDLAESEAVLASGVLEVGKAKLHGEDEGVRVRTKPVGLLSVVPVGEVGLWIGGVLDNHVLDAVPESGGPFKDALYGGRIRGYDGDGGESDAEGSQFAVYGIEPIEGDLAGASTHVGEDQCGATIGELVNESVEAGRSVDVHLAS
jgi:hypothetical protein